MAKYKLTIEVTVSDKQLYAGCPIKKCIRAVTLEDGTRMPAAAQFKVVKVKPLK